MAVKSRTAAKFTIYALLLNWHACKQSSADPVTGGSLKHVYNAFNMSAEEKETG